MKDDEKEEVGNLQRSRGQAEQERTKKKLSRMMRKKRVVMFL